MHALWENRNVSHSDDARPRQASLRIEGLAVQALREALLHAFEPICAHEDMQDVEISWYQAKK